jgi:hypothetical protein
MNRIFLSLSLSTLMLFGTSRGQRVQPVAPGPEGQRAFDDLAKAYANSHGAFDDKVALTDLDSSDPVIARRGGNYLLALFEQTFADETNGLTENRPAPFFGESEYNRALAFRNALVKDFGASASTEAALPAALWLIENDPLADNEETGAQALAHIHTEGANAAIAKIISEIHPNQEVLLIAIREAGNGDVGGGSVCRSCLRC